ncbi:MAG: MBOAT family protein [Propionibacteriaceae bacterium]|jgi:alginate O-acetyltransferase complex protein AlgI|nr:MBOAT family protein [Propionibacteriaceae bacterium]
MLFSSVTFIYYFLPGVLALYFAVLWLTRGRQQPGSRAVNAVLLVASFVFYAWGEPKYALLMAAEILFVWAVGLAQVKARKTRINGANSESASNIEKLLLIATVVIPLAILGYFKYADFFIDSFNAVAGTELPILRLALPIGISFYTFQMVSYSIDLYTGKVEEAGRNLIDFACYVVLFVALIAGPIVRYSEIAAQLIRRDHSIGGFADGVSRFAVGLAKKVLIANLCGELVAILKDSPDESVLATWLYVVAFALQIYFDFSGYSDMAIGLGAMFGFHLPENFNYPYIATSITDFWRRWHMTLSSWFRDYVYIPLGGSFVGAPRQIRNIAVVWAATGFWHGAAWQFIGWGLFFALFLSIEKFAFGGALQRLSGPVGHIYLLLAVGISWVLFDAASFGDAGRTLGHLVGAGSSGLVGDESLYYLRSYAVMLLIGVIGATPLPARLVHAIGERDWGIKLLTVAQHLGIVLLLLLATAFLVDGSFNPFIYFRF